MYNDSSAAKARLNFFKLILLLAGIAVALYLALNRVKFQNKAAQYPATLAFTPQTATVAVGSAFQAPILLNTGGGAIRGVDVRLTFDKTKLQLTDISPNAATTTTLKTFAPITSNNTFDTVKVINNANSNGVIEFGAISADMSTSNVTSAYNGSTVLATLTFTGLASSTTSVNFDPSTVPATNLTTDTNIVVDSNPPVDTLSSVTNLSVTVSGSGPTVTLAPPTLSPTPGAICYDITGDRVVNVLDLKKMAINFGTCVSGTTCYDVTGDNIVNVLDLKKLAINFGTCP